MDVAQIKFILCGICKRNKKKEGKWNIRLYTGKLKISSHLDYSLLNRIKTIECIMYTQLYYYFILFILLYIYYIIYIFLFNNKDA